MSTRRDFLKSTLVAAVAAPLLKVDRMPRAGVASFALDEVTIEELREGLESSKFTARKLAELYLARNQADLARSEVQEVLADDAHAPAFQRKRDRVWVRRASVLSVQE